MSTFLRPIYSTLKKRELLNYFLHNVDVMFSNKMNLSLSWIIANTNDKKIIGRVFKWCIIYQNIDILEKIIEYHGSVYWEVKHIPANVSINFLYELTRCKLKWSSSAIMDIIMTNDLEIIQWVETYIKYDATHLILACEKGLSNVIEYLISNPIEKDLIDLHNDNMLVLDNECFEILCKCQHFDIFLKYINLIVKFTHSMLMYIGFYKSLPIIYYIMENFAEHRTELVNYICVGEHYELLLELVKKYPNIIQSETIHYACSTGNVKIIDFVVQHLRENKMVSEESKVLKIKYKASEKFKYYWLEKTLGVDPATKLKYIQENFNKNKDELEKVSEFEQRTEEWFESRKFIVTSTAIASIVGEHDAYKSIRDFLKEKITPTFKGNELTQYGTCTEFLSFAMTYLQLCYEYIYKKKCDILIQKEVGLKIWNEHPWIGASADGICDVYTETEKIEEITIELKSPTKLKFYPECPHYYYDQFTCAQIVSNRMECRFCVFTPVTTQYNCYRCDIPYWKLEIFPRLCDRYMNYVLPRLILNEQGLIAPGETEPTFTIK